MYLYQVRNGVYMVTDEELERKSKEMKQKKKKKRACLSEPPDLEIIINRRVCYVKRKVQEWYKYNATP